MNEIVKYHNDMNTVALRKFSATELDLLMSICHIMRDESIDFLTLDFAYLKELTQFSSTTVTDFVKALDNTYNKLIQTNIKIGNDTKWTRFVLFTEYTIDTKEQTVTIGVNKKFQYILNELQNRFTRFELGEFINLKSSYAKECYRRLKQFRTTGEWFVTIDEFKRVLDIPKSYQMCDIDKWVINPIKKELSPLFDNFYIIKEYKKGRGRGGKVVSAIRFEFDKEVPETCATVSSQLQLTSHICPKCNKPLYETVLNGSNCWCHNFVEQGDDCKAIYNSIAEIKGYNEIPAPNNTYAADKKAVLNDMKALKSKIIETLNE